MFYNFSHSLVVPSLPSVANYYYIVYSVKEAVVLMKTSLLFFFFSIYNNNNQHFFSVRVPVPYHQSGIK